MSDSVEIEEEEKCKKTKIQTLMIMQQVNENKSTLSSSSSL